MLALKIVSVYNFRRHETEAGDVNFRRVVFVSGVLPISSKNLCSQLSVFFKTRGVNSHSKLVPDTYKYTIHNAAEFSKSRLSCRTAAVTMLFINPTLGDWFLFWLDHLLHFLQKAKERKLRSTTR